jgi:hypothetical protein
VADTLVFDVSLPQLEALLPYSTRAGIATLRAVLIGALAFVISASLVVACSGAKAQGEPDETTTSGIFSLNPTPLPPPRPPISMVVNLRTQRAYIYRDGIRIRSTPISTGKRGYRTPTGTFSVLEKQKVHHSNKYDNAPMPFMQRLSWYGLALHAGHVPGFPASHGCVRMPLTFARWLYSEPTLGMRVVITDQRPAETPVAIPRREAPPAVAPPASDDDSQSDTDSDDDEPDAPQ